MQKLFLTALLIAIALPAMGDGTATLIQWPGWICQSTEDLSLGRRHNSFPLTHLFDGDPSTAWVFSGTGKHVEGWPTGYAITLIRGEHRKPVAVDSIWIMNGYNRSSDLFVRNNRITELKLYLNSKFVKTVTLADSMGWSKISIPRQLVKEIKLRFTKFAVGRDNDVCVSEIAIYDQGACVGPKMPRAVEFTEGDVDCGCGQEWQLIDRDGKSLERYDTESPAVWSPSDRFIAGARDGQLWVVDAATAKIIERRTLYKNNRYWLRVGSWHGDHSVNVSIEKNFPRDMKNPDDYRTIYSTKTFRIAGS